MAVRKGGNKKEQHRERTEQGGDDKLRGGVRQLNEVRRIGKPELFQKGLHGARPPT